MANFLKRRVCIGILFAQNHQCMDRILIFPYQMGTSPGILAQFVVEAEGGRRGLELARAQAPDLILLDLMMPDLSGLEVCQELKKDARLSKIPIVVLSSSDDSDEIETCLQLGAQDYLLKPFRPAMLLDIVRKNVTKAGAA